MYKRICDSYSSSQSVFETERMGNYCVNDRHKEREEKKCNQNRGSELRGDVGTI